MTTPKNNGKGTQGVTTQPTNNNGKAVNAAAVDTTKKEEQPAGPKAEPTPAPKTLEEQRRYFDGLYRLTTMRGRYEEHKAAIEDMVVSEDDLKEFEVGRHYNIGITITDSYNTKYEVKHPYLVKLLCEFIASHFDQKIAECEDKILNYGE